MHSNCSLFLEAYSSNVVLKKKKKGQQQLTGAYCSVPVAVMLAAVSK